MQISEKEIIEFLKTHDIFAKKIALYQQDDNITDYLIDNRYILRISNTIPDKQVKLERVKAVSYTPKIHSSGMLVASGCKLHYSIDDYVQGNELMSDIQNLTNTQKKDIGKELAHFLTELHSITDDAYDIGHYIPTIPRYKGSWKNGHAAYIKTLQNGLSELDIEPKSTETVARAFEYIYANIHSLEYEAGPKLLHNDFHPKNMIVDEGKLAGVIDWECSQYGEADFELSHLFHWCIYEVPNNHLSLLLKAVVDNLQIAVNIPHIERRLTIYQLEHEINQLIWNGKKQEHDRMRRINGWLNGQIDALFSQWQ